MGSRVVGIYYFKSIEKNWYYIGKSVNANERKYRHLSELKNNKHPNKKLQNHFLKYGESDLKYGILEVVQKFSNLEKTKKKLSKLEIFYISKYNSFDNGFNLTRGGDGLRGCGRKFSLINTKTNEVKSFNSLNEATYFIGCSSPSSIHAVLSKKCNTCKGWCRADDEKREIRTGSYSKEFTLTHPEYGMYTGKNQSEFKRKFNINCDVSSLIKGLRKNCCGWRVAQKNN